LSYTRTALDMVPPASLSGREDLNLRPPAPKAGALPGCATPREEAAREYNKGRNTLNYGRRGHGPDLLVEETSP
jgi:hypothetical protein